MSDVVQFVGDYEVLETLGSGAAGSAYKARNRETGDMVAVKLMHERMAGQPDIQNRFVREVSVLQKLDHPNVVHYVDCGLDDGRIYLAMEWLEFGSLDSVLNRRGSLPWREAVEVSMQICDGLDHAHSKGVIHRDLKPANLFLSKDGLVKIGDFGLARDADLHRLTMSGNTVGSCRYMAPEQVRGEEELTGAVDVYALGCLLYRMLSGRAPFDGATIIEIFEAHLYNDIPAIDGPRGDRPQALDDLVALLLTKDVTHRPGKASEVRDALAAILAGEQVAEEFTPAKLPEPEEQANAEQGESGEAPPPQNLTQRLVEGAAQTDTSKTPNMRILLIVVGLVVLVGVIVLLAQNR
ncbi:serine/threonine-protein kinase [Aeoliella sp.]|uniref:serine/threonine-protein kinase n=1 Tax=Aeoliella sp. TaxID=2795800 RepID=UPI003CCBF346